MFYIMVSKCLITGHSSFGITLWLLLIKCDRDVFMAGLLCAATLSFNHQAAFKGPIEVALFPIQPLHYPQFTETGSHTHRGYSSSFCQHMILAVSTKLKSSPAFQSLVETPELK